MSPQEEKIVAELRAELAALTKKYNAIIAKTAPLEAEADAVWRELEKIEAKWKDLRQRAVKIEIAEGLPALSAQRARLSRAINAITGGPKSETLEGGQIGMTP